jgi:ParB family transcriptional regulator, chromosome partitioning protein
VLSLNDADVAALAEAIRAAGGAPIGAYRDPLGGRALVLATLPLGGVPSRSTPRRRTT